MALSYKMVLGWQAAGASGVTLDAVGPGAAVTNAVGNTLTWTHTPVGTPTGIVIGLYVYNTFSTGATYGGVAMAHDFSQYDGSNAYCEMYSLNAPLSGPRSVIITFNANGAYALTNSFSFLNSSGQVASPSPVWRVGSGVFSGPTTSAIQTTTITSQANDMAIDVVGAQGGNVTFSATGSNSLLWSANTGAGGISIALSTQLMTGTSATNSWNSSASTLWQQTMYAIMHA